MFSGPQRPSATSARRLIYSLYMTSFMIMTKNHGGSIQNLWTKIRKIEIGFESQNRKSNNQGMEGKGRRRAQMAR